MSERISKKQIHEQFVDALEGSVRGYSNLSDVPLNIQLTPPLPPKVRVYAYDVTTPPGSGPNGEHIARLITPDQSQGERSSFDHSEGHFVLLLGYAPDSGVFILWDAGLHRNFQYSKPVKVDPGPIYEAIAGDIGRQERRLHTGTEIVLTANAGNLPDAIEMRSDLTTKRLTN